jgi:hypothetical protein
MKKAELKAGRMYATPSGGVVECLDLGEGRFPRTPRFRVVYPFAGQERFMEARELTRELSPRETEEFAKVKRA